MPLVSVVIPTFNEERYIEACLESLGRQSYPPSALEVLVADGGSTDSTRAIVAAQASRSPFPIRLVENPGRTTPHGLNAGVAAAGGDVIVILGAHSLVDSEFVAANVEALRRTGAAATGGPIETRGEGSVASAIAAALSHPFGVGDARFRYATEPGYVDTIAFAAYRRECFDAAGGFATDREKAEDDFFNYCVRRAGGRLYLTPTVRSVYFARSGFGAVARQYFGYGKAKGRASVEAPDSIQPRHLVPAAAVAGGFALFAAGAFSDPARKFLTLAGVAYTLLAAASAVQSTRRRHQPQLAPVALVIFPLVHVSYGLGTLIGAARAAFRRY